MSDCGCNKNRTAPTGATASRQEAQAVANKATDQAAASRARAANPSTSRIGPMQGQTQQFALRTRDGRSVTGSLLEVRAEQRRRGGVIAPA